jgi:hypothetical protein
MQDFQSPLVNAKRLLSRHETELQRDREKADRMIAERLAKIEFYRAEVARLEAEQVSV